MIETRSSVAELLERLEEAKRVLDNPDRIDDMILKLSRLEKFLSKFGTIKELAEHLHFIEHKMYMVKEFLTTDEAADFLRISKSLLYKLTRTREIPIYLSSRTVLSILMLMKQAMFCTIPASVRLMRNMYQSWSRQPKKTA